MKKFKHIRAYYSGWILPLVDFLILYPTLLIMRRKTTKGSKESFENASIGSVTWT